MIPIEAYTVEQLESQAKFGREALIKEMDDFFEDFFPAEGGIRHPAENIVANPKSMRGYTFDCSEYATLRKKLVECGLDVKKYDGEMREAIKGMDETFKRVYSEETLKLLFPTNRK